ncbi:MAG: cation:proton antiporter [Endozoicomonadaceae bacterium]|nr:cation:proton antiporter [Endozoicomonadaceae bacterium]
MNFDFFQQIIIIFSLSVVCIAVFHRLRISDTLAYLVVGLILGPTATGIIDSSFDISLLAEIGVVFLLFSLGLEFSLPNMMAMRKIVFGLGGLQVLICTILIGFCGLLMGFSHTGSLVMAAGLSLSSTAIVSKELSRRNEIRSTYGQLTIGTLIFQDIAAVFFLILVPTVGGLSDNGLATSLLLSLAKGSAFVIFMLIIGRWLMPRIFNEIARARSEELFVLTAIVVALLAAWLTHLLSLSMALGGFVAGMMLGESHYRHQVETDIRPFRDILLGLFFVSIGLMLDINQFIAKWHLILIASAALIFFKATLISQLSYFVFSDRKASIRTGLSLAQGGEFCFALVALATHNHFLSASTSSFILSVTIVSMAFTPLLIRYSKTISEFLVGQRKNKPTMTSSADRIQQETEKLNNHILICGYGRVGQAISRFMDQEDLPFAVLDDDPVHVREASNAGIPVFYGDCQRVELLQAAGLQRAKLVAICINSFKNAHATLKQIRKVNPDIPILIRTRDDTMMKILKQDGATQVFPEVLESSLLIISHVLHLLGHSKQSIIQRTDAVRRHHYNILQGSFFGTGEALHDNDGNPQQFLHAVTLPEKAYAVGKRLSMIPLEKTGVYVQKVTRDNTALRLCNDPLLQSDDRILINGTSKQIEYAKIILLGGQ